MQNANAPIGVRVACMPVYRDAYVNACRKASQATSESDVLFWKDQARKAYAEMIRLGWTPDGVI